MVAVVILPDHIHFIWTLPDGDRDYSRRVGRIKVLFNNPIKHGWVSCPHLWPHSSFQKWIVEGHYQSDWACWCKGRVIDLGSMLANRRVGLYDEC